MNLNHPPQSLKGKKIHFIGIGGIGMSALARLFHAKGSIISGSDKEHSATTSALQVEGIKNIWTPHSKNNLEKANPDYVIYSTAINTSNEEFNYAKDSKKKLLHRSELLEIATLDKKLISVSGTHGKTTTSSMISSILLNSNLAPSAVLGGILLDKETNIVIGDGEYFVIEADESDKSLLKGSPEIAVITNIEADHLENYPGGLEEIKKTFLEFAKKAVLKTGLVACFQDKITKELITKHFSSSNQKIISYSTNESTTVYAKQNKKENSWDIFFKGEYKTSVKLNNPGEHNVLNALAAFSTCYLVGVSPEKIKQALENYRGVKRRFEIVGRTKEITIVDDYAHHPTEIAATIKAAKELNPKRLIIILQPHQPTRLRDLWSDFIEVLKNEDAPIFITDTYIARGKEIKGISSKKLVSEINKSNINYLPGNISEISSQLEKLIQNGDLVLIMGAGDITNLGPRLLKSREQLV